MRVCRRRVPAVMMLRPSARALPGRRDAFSAGLPRNAPRRPVRSRRQRTGGPRTTRHGLDDRGKKDAHEQAHRRGRIRPGRIAPAGTPRSVRSGERARQLRHRHDLPHHQREEPRDCGEGPAHPGQSGASRCRRRRSGGRRRLWHPASWCRFLMPSSPRRRSIWAFPCRARGNTASASCSCPVTTPAGSRWSGSGRRRCVTRG